METNTLIQHIKGPVFPIPVPFANDYSVDLVALNDYVEYLLAEGAEILMLTVGTSRFALLTDEEILGVNEAIVKAAKGQALTITANPLYGATSQSIKFAEHAEAAGSDIILLIYPERYYHDDDIYEYFATVSSACAIGVMVHEMPLRSGRTGVGPSVHYSIDLLERILSIENVVGMKEESNDSNHASQIIRAFSAKTAIICGAGGMNNFLRTFPQGAESYLVGIGSFVPSVEIGFYKELKNGNFDKAREIVASKETPFFELAVKLGWHPALKEAMNFKGVMKATERPPLKRIPAEERDSIKKILIESELI